MFRNGAATERRHRSVLRCVARAARRPAAAIPAAAAALPRYAENEGYEPAGLPVLRAAVAQRFTARGVPTGADQMLITSGASHALDLLLRLLVVPATAC